MSDDQYKFKVDIEDPGGASISDVQSEVVAAAVNKVAAIRDKTAEQALIVAQQQRIREMQTRVIELEEALVPFSLLEEALSPDAEGKCVCHEKTASSPINLLVEQGGEIYKVARFTFGALHQATKLLGEE